MPRLVHLTGASSRRGIERAGIRGSVGYLGLARAVFAMPVLPDFGVTHQWLRELKRRHGERMIAVHFEAPSDEVVLVGRYARSHATVSLREAVRRVIDEPAGAEIVLTRSIAKKDVLAIRETAQLIGWTEVPSGEPKSDCVCPSCVPRGSPDLLRRARASFERQLLRARKATDDRERARALGECGSALERARGRLSPAKLFGFARSPSAEVRIAATELLGQFRWVDVQQVLARLRCDPESAVRRHAAGSTFRAAGLRRAWPLLSEGDEEAHVALAEHLVFDVRDVAISLPHLEKLATVASPRVLRAMANDLRLLLRDDELEADQRARLERLRDQAP